MRVMLQGYSRTRPVLDKGVHTGVNTSRVPPDGCQDLSLPSYTICAAGTLSLWLVMTDGD